MSEGPNGPSQPQMPQMPQQHKTTINFDLQRGTVVFTPAEINGVALVNPTPVVMQVQTIIELAATLILGHKQMREAAQQQSRIMKPQ